MRASIRPLASGSLSIFSRDGVSTVAGLREVASEFPVLRRKVDGHPLTYLDSSATSQTPQPVIDVHHGMARDDIPAGISIPIPGRSEDG